MRSLFDSKKPASTAGIASLVGAVLTAGAVGAAAREPLTIVTDATTVTVNAGDRPIMRYRYAEVPFKPYVQQLYSPAGVNVLRDAPHDHKHHHALMFAVAVDGVNFWEEHDAPGRQAHLGLTDVRIDRAGPLDRAGFTETLDWVNPADGKVLLQEARTIEVLRADALPASLVSWQSRLTVPPGKTNATLTGSRYFGLGVRFVSSMDKGGRFFNADGKTGVAGTNEARSLWCAYTASADGKPVTVAVFDHPTNARHPADWFTMEEPFAYVAATMGLDAEPFVLTRDRPLVLRYGVALWDGQIDADGIAQAYRLWAAWPTATGAIGARKSPASAAPMR